MEKSWNRPALSDEHLLGMLDAFPGSVFAILPDKDVSFPIYMNQDCLKMLEADTYDSACSYCGGNFWKYVDPADRQQVAEVYERLGRAVGTTDLTSAS